MKILPIKTHKIRPYRQGLFDILDKYLISLKEGSIVAITSKIISICEGRVAKIGEAEYFLPPEKSKYNITLAIK